MRHYIKHGTAILLTALALTGCNPSKENIQNMIPHDLNVTVHVDGNATEESGTIEQNGTGVVVVSVPIPASPLSVTALSLSETQNNLVLKMEGTFPKESHHDFYIDADNDTHTGYSKDEILGADYLIEDGQIYRYPTGAHGWKWVRMGETAQTEIAQNHTVFRIRKDALSLTQTIRVGASVGTDDFSHIVRYKNMQLFSLKKKDTTPPTIHAKSAKIFLIGDSTVHNHDLPDGHGSYRELGWGDMLGQFMKAPDNLYNGARSGASSTSYRQSKQGKHDWEKTLNKIKQSDLTHGGFLLIQFGHNDESGNPSLHTDPGREESFYMALKYYIDQAKALNLKPILVSPVQRQMKTHNHIGYSDTVRALAEDEKVRLLDLSEKSHQEFAAYDSNEDIHAKFGYDDTTHFNPWGAQQVASWVRDLACEEPESTLCKQFQSSTSGETTVSFKETPLALKNPLKGFMIYPNGQSPREFVSLYKRPIAWNHIEQNINDGVDKIRTYTNIHLFYSDVTKKRVEEQNIKSIPIVILKKRRSDDFSPDDMSISEHDNQTEVFADRVKNLVEKLGKAWDEDPRIGFIYMGIVGTWGEQFDPNVSTMMAKVLGDSFQKAFLHKKVLVRLPGYFNESYLNKHNHRFLGKTYDGGFSFGMYWDAFGWEKELTNALDTQGVIETPMWKTEPMLGEVAFNVDSDYIYNTVSGSSKHSGDPIHDTLAHKDSLKYIEDYIRITHATALSWIADYNANDAAENVAAQTLQKIMGYRFVLQNALYTKTVNSGKKLHVKCSVKNLGSAPFYYRWPLKVSLLNPETKKVVWSGIFSATDIRNWLPGDNWDREENRYKIPAQTYMAEQEFDLPEAVDEGEYILALSINDPAGDKPSVRFANKRYLKGGWIPVGMMGVGANPTDMLPVSDEPREDKLSYRLH